MTGKIREALSLLDQLSDEAAELVLEAEAEVEAIEQMFHDAHNGRAPPIVATPEQVAKIAARLPELRGETSACCKNGGSALCQGSKRSSHPEHAAHVERQAAPCRECGHMRFNHRKGPCGVYVVEWGKRCPCLSFSEAAS